MVEIKLTQKIGSLLPPLYAGWMEEVLPGPVHSEARASCHDCAMCQKPEDSGTQKQQFFNPKIKCCTYIPNLPNFLVGRIISDDSPGMAFGRAKVEERLDDRTFSTPLALCTPPRFSLFYQHSPGAFGHSETMRCPYYIEEGGKCGVWLHRNAICTTWFCKHEQGRVGWQFWRRIQQLLMHLEDTLVKWCVLQLDPGSEALGLMFPTSLHRSSGSSGEELRVSDIDETLDLKTYKTLWGNWFGREKEFFRECAVLVNGLTWAEIVSLGGPEIGANIRLTREAYDKKVSPVLPEVLVAPSLEIISADQKGYLANSYSPFDPVHLPRQLLEVLYYFDGRPTSQVVEAIALDKNLRLNESFLRKLVHFGILVPG